MSEVPLYATALFSASILWKGLQGCLFHETLPPWTIVGPLEQPYCRLPGEGGLLLFCGRALPYEQGTPVPVGHRATANRLFHLP